MIGENRLSEKWIKASITGTIWAASEIVLGSFLHNLRIPFGGNILTAIGLIILISISYVWTERGIFWRAGLICALMKTLSPSAVIFGPMIAIFTEALLMEVSVFILGRTVPGFLIGSMLAMSWNLFQKIVNYLIIYGSDITLVYSNLLKMAQKQMNIQTDIVWLPIIALLILFAIFGMLSGIIGMMVGRRLLNQPENSGLNIPETKEINKNKKQGAFFNYSVPWLFADILLMIISFILLNKVSWIFWSISIIAVIILWSYRYKRALRQISRPGFWIFFVIITLVTAFVFSEATAGENPIREGILTGIQMNFRAAVVILGFSVIGTELYNPVIRKFFSGTSLKNLPLALELSAESLPAFIANIPDLKYLVKNPVVVFHKVISQAESRLKEIRNINEQSSGLKNVFILTGQVGGGKTTFTGKLIQVLKEENIEVEGIISKKILDPEGKTGYDVVNILTGEQVPFLRQDSKCGQGRIGRFTICEKGFEHGRNILDNLKPGERKIEVIDEVGLLEIGNNGWAGSIERLLKSNTGSLIMTSRTSFAGSIIEKWNLANAITINIHETGLKEAADMILSKIAEPRLS